ncbi:hypothetical protein [Streptomyces sp. S.PB5]|uniref:hypothetical protein n=1 Tax=Streptomyces sp. S.PB5 TaxID=3020844 RepID=UPI0025B10FB7|nr:hypothetical protein [Streptomyces sp. S.PB5]MDN3024135.1 hypothetical protein [Streptomyces sp. S.PB5]
MFLAAAGRRTERIELGTAVIPIGFSTGMPHAHLLGDVLRCDHLCGPDTVIHSPGNVQRPRLQPHNPGLAQRIWYGADAATRARHRACAASRHERTLAPWGPGRTLFAPDVVGGAAMSGLP